MEFILASGHVNGLDVNERSSKVRAEFRHICTKRRTEKVEKKVKLGHTVH